MLKEEIFTGLVSAITTPYVADDKIICMVINLIEVIPPAPETPYVLTVDTTKPTAAAMMLLMATAYVTRTRIAIGLEPIIKSRVAWAKVGQ